MIIIYSQTKTQFTFMKRFTVCSGLTKIVAMTDSITTAYDAALEAIITYHLDNIRIVDHVASRELKLS